MKDDKALLDKNAEDDPVILDVLCIALLVVVSIVFAYLGITQFVAKAPYNGLEYIGISIASLSGCFDPINIFWNLLPYGIGQSITNKPVSLKMMIGVLCGLGVTLLGYIGNHH